MKKALTRFVIVALENAGKILPYLAAWIILRFLS
jgi:hypothetical protein